MQTVPIKLTWTPLPVGVNPLTLDQLGTVMAAYMAGQISSDVTFIPIGASDPTLFTSPLIFNDTQGVFKYWNTGSGKYVTVTPFQPGDTKNTFITGDEIQQGWILLDGRLISAVSGISQNQTVVLQQLFGIGGSLPTVTPALTLADLPAAAAYSSIALSGIIQPPQGQIGALPFGATYDPSQSQGLGANTETLRNQTENLRIALQTVNGVNIRLLSALRGTETSVSYVTKVYVGTP